jgi:competence protein ComEC
MAEAARERIGANGRDRRFSGPGLMMLPGVLPWELTVAAYACGLYAAHDPLAGVGAFALALWFARLYAAAPLRARYPLIALVLGVAVGVAVLPAPPGPEPDFVVSGQKVRIEGTVAAVEFRPDRRLEIHLRDVSAAPPAGAGVGPDGPAWLPGPAASATTAEPSAPVRLPGLVSLSYDEPPRLPAPGDRLRFISRVRAAYGFANPGAAERAFSWLLRDIRYTVYAAADTGVELTPHIPPDPVWALRLRLRGLILGAGPETDGAAPPGFTVSPGRGVVLALLMGDRSYLGSADLDRVRRATLTHTLALAGLHLGFVAAMGYMLAAVAGYLWPGLYLRLPRPKLAVVLGAPLVAIYLWLGQFTPSLTRAAVMFAAWGVLLLCNRNRVLLDGLFWAVALILAVNPRAVFDLRMQLSVVSVAAIALLFPLGRLIVPLTGTSRWRRLLIPAWGLLWVSLCAQLGVLPLLVANFGEISPNLLYNLPWVPVMGFVVLPAAFFGLVFALVPLGATMWAGQALLGLAAWVSDLFLRGLAFLDAHHLLEAWPGLRPAWPETLGFFVLLGALVCFLATGRRALAVAGLGLALLTAPQVLRVCEESRAAVSLTMIDVGQGQALLVCAPGGRRVLVDGGGFHSDYDMGRELITPLLTANAPPRLTALVMTHPDRDHALGLVYPAGWFRVGSFFYNGDLPRGALGRRYREALARSGLVPHPAVGGDVLDLGGGVALTVLSPWPESRGDENNRGVVLRLTWNGRGLALLTADIGRRAIRDLLARGTTLAAEAMSAPHHGSAGSLVPDFYDRVKPGLVLASCGRGNQWGFPAAAVRAEVSRQGAGFYATPESGAVTLIWEDAEAAVRVETQRGADGLRTPWFWGRSWP